MGEFEKLQVGDNVIRVMEGLGDEVWTFDGKVVEVSRNIITCAIQSDVIRTMKFDRTTGINVNGQDYGWLL